MDRKYPAYVLFIVVTIWAFPIYGGDYVTYKDPKTGAMYFCDDIPSEVPKDTKVEVKRHKSVPVLDAYKSVPIPASKYKSQPQTTTSTSNNGSQPQTLPRASSEYEKLMSGVYDPPPAPPNRSPVFRDFNRATNQQGQYEQKMFEYRMKRYDAGYRSLP